MSKKKAQRNARKKLRFQIPYLGMTRTDWAKLKKLKKIK